MQDGTRAIFLVDEIFKLQPAGADALPLACMHGRWMWRLIDTMVGGLKPRGVRKLPRPQAQPRRLWASDDVATLRVDVAECVVRVNVFCNAPFAPLTGAALEAAALAPLSAGEPPFSYWCNQSYNDSQYFRFENLRASWRSGAAEEARDALPPGFVAPEEPPPKKLLRTYGARLVSRRRRAQVASQLTRPRAAWARRRILWRRLLLQRHGDGGAPGRSLRHHARRGLLPVRRRRLPEEPPGGARRVRRHVHSKCDDAWAYGHGRHGQPHRRRRRRQRQQLGRCG